MLFDLHGKRRRVVQATYLMLAVLMGGGLVLFGIGSDASGGLLDGCSGDSTSDGGSADAERRIDGAQARLQANPRDSAALADLVRGNYQLANDVVDPNSGAFGAEGTAKLQAASDAWQKYLELEPPKPDDSLAGLMVQAYGLDGLNDPEKGAEAADIVAGARPSPQSFLALAQFAALAGQSRKAELAGKRAVELAPKSQRGAVEADLKRIDKAVEQLEAAEGATGGSGAVAPQGGATQGPGGIQPGAPGGPGGVEPGVPQGQGGGASQSRGPPGGGRP